MSSGEGCQRQSHGRDTVEVKTMPQQKKKTLHSVLTDSTTLWAVLHIVCTHTHTADGVSLAFCNISTLAVLRNCLHSSATVVPPPLNILPLPSLSVSLALEMFICTSLSFPVLLIFYFLSLFVVVVVFVAVICRLVIRFFYQAGVLHSPSTFKKEKKREKRE